MAFHWNITPPFRARAFCHTQRVINSAICNIFSQLSLERPSPPRWDKGSGDFFLPSLSHGGSSRPFLSCSLACPCSVPGEHHGLKVLQLQNHTVLYWNILCKSPPFHSTACLVIIIFPTASLVIIWIAPSQPVSLPDCLFIVLKAFHLLVPPVFLTHLTALTSCAPSCLEYLE